MPCCCVNILNLCSKPVCGELVIDQPAGGASGDNYYTLVLDYLENSITLRDLQVEGENIHFDISGLNENYQYTGQIFDANGELVSIGDYDCVKFKTVISLSTTPAAEVEPEVDLIEKFQISEDSTYTLPAGFMIYKILLLPTAADTVAIEYTVAGGEIMFPTTLTPDVWTSVTMDIFSDDDGTIIYFTGVTATMTVIIYKLPV